MDAFVLTNTSDSLEERRHFEVWDGVDDVAGEEAIDGEGVHSKAGLS